MKKGAAILLGFVLVLAVGMTDNAGVQALSLCWDPSTSAGVTQYGVYLGKASRNYSYSSTTNLLCEDISAVGMLFDGHINYAAATAKDASGNESDYSEELAFSVPALDTDGDGLSDYDEINVYGTNPLNPDTIGDGMGDGARVALWGVDWDKDFDGDGIINLFDPDADGDGYLDSQEVASGSNPASMSSLPPIIKEDAENGDLLGWTKPSAGAMANLAADNFWSSRYVQLTGAGSYKLKNDDTSLWGISTHKFFTLELATLYDFYVHVEVLLTSGVTRYVSYTTKKAEGTFTISGSYIYVGISPQYKNNLICRLDGDLPAAVAQLNLVDANGNAVVINKINSMTVALVAPTSGAPVFQLDNVTLRTELPAQ